MRNSGVELGFGVTPLQTKDMELSINVNVTFQQNKLLSLSGMYKGEQMSAPEYTSISDLNGAGFHGGYNHIVYQVVGQPLGVFYLPHCTGLTQQEDGSYRYEIADLNGDGVNLEDGEDRYIAGQATPKTMLGSNISFRYKQFDVSFTDKRSLRAQDIQRDFPYLYEYGQFPRLQCDARCSGAEYKGSDGNGLLVGER